MLSLYCRKEYAPRTLVAQWIEHLPSKQRVGGSNPLQGANRYISTDGSGLLHSLPAILNVASLIDWSLMDLALESLLMAWLNMRLAEFSLMGNLLTSDTEGQSYLTVI